MNAKLFLTAFLLPIVINCVNIGQAMEGANYDKIKTELSQKMQKLDTEINVFVDKLTFKDRDIGINTTKDVINWMANIENITNAMRSDTLFDFTLDDFFSFLFEQKIIKEDNQKIQLNILWRKIQKANIDHNFYWYNKFHGLLSLKESIENLNNYLKQNKNQILSNKININYEKTSKLWNELDNVLSESNTNIDKNKLTDFIYQYKNIISDYYNHQNETKSYAKQYEINNLFENKTIVDYIQKIAQLNCEQEKLMFENK